MKTIGERIKLVIDSERLNENSFSKRIGKSYTAIAKIVKGDSKPGFEIIESILVEFPNIDADWLIHGTGSMTKNDTKMDRPDAYLQNHLKNLEIQFTEMKEMFHSELAVKNRQIEKLMELLGKLNDVAEEAQELPLWGEIMARA